MATLYPPDDTTRVTVEGLTRQLEGASRPGHLDGLTTVMLKLIHLVGPARLYIGQRHAQQVVIVRRMLRDLFMNVELVMCPTVRDDDGLAISSANALLGIEERHAATCLYNALSAAKEAYDAGERSAEVLRWRMTDVLSREPRARIDYVSVADAGLAGGAPARLRTRAGAAGGLDRPRSADRQHAARLGRRLGASCAAIESTSAGRHPVPYDAACHRDGGPPADARCRCMGGRRVPTSGLPSCSPR